MESTETAVGRHPYLRCKNTAVKGGPDACGKRRETPDFAPIYDAFMTIAPCGSPAVSRGHATKAAHYRTLAGPTRDIPRRASHLRRARRRPPRRPLSRDRDRARRAMGAGARLDALPEARRRRAWPPAPVRARGAGARLRPARSRARADVAAGAGRHRPRSHFGEADRGLSPRALSAGPCRPAEVVVAATARGVVLRRIPHGGQTAQIDAAGPLHRHLRP